MKTKWLGVYLAVFLSSVLAGTGLVQAGLPTNHAWQVTLRNHMATLQESDFDISLAALVYDSAYLTDVEQVYRVWQWHDNLGRTTTSDEGLRVASSHFTLASIESGGNVNMTANYDSFQGAVFIDPMATAWWAQWDYPGNPHRPGTSNSVAAMRRAFVVAAVDLIMLNNYHSSGYGLRSDFMGGSLIWQAYVYDAVKDILPSGVQTAYETGLTNIFARLENLTPHGTSGADMETFQLVGMWYVAEALDNNDLRNRALDRAHDVLDAIMKPAGYEHHGNAFDASYMGIALRFMTWSAHLYQDQRITETLDGMSKLKAHLTFPEPGSGFARYMAGPNHFNTATHMGCHNDQWGKHFRDVAAAMLSDEALYLNYGGRGYDSWFDPLGIRSESSMRSDLATKNWMENALSTSASTRTPPTWSEKHWVHVNFNYGHDVYTQGFYQRALQLQTEKNRLTLAPFLRNGNFIEPFGTNAIMAIKLGEYGAVVHTDVIRDTWAGNIAGLSGGGLSAFWSPVTGAIIMGLNGGAQSFPETWAQWRNWAVHAISGENQDYKPFSSARNAQPGNVVYTVGTTNAAITFDGTIGGSMSAPNNAITGNVKYERAFYFDARGARITSTLKRLGGNDRVRWLWEMIPIHLSAGGYGFTSPQGTDAEIHFWNGTQWIAATTTLSTGITRVRVTRYGESVYIEFASPRSVRMSPNAVRHHSSMSKTWNLMVDLLGSGGSAVRLPASTSVEYWVYLPPPALRIAGWPNDYGTPGALNYGRHTGISFGSWITNQVESTTTAINGIRQSCQGWELSDHYGVAIDSDSSTQAVFQLGTNSVLTWNWTNQYDLALTIDGSGSLSKTNGWYGSGEFISITAYPDSGHQFTGWSGETENTTIDGDTISFTHDKPRSLTASFAEDEELESSGSTSELKVLPMLR